ncbi:E3 ubiquitin-protein ligase LRSAM1 [Corythoichthys intestinalis]|uniref:E3 ubiquitin-protein ligase LRSAM1 n=1 Tax=Corythoichthys intestinalis TaxID=161448 RepID=UPI0025A58BBE|nr:E3 ubiquitin-protein ligase LRSAM1 [Corythoichthys intestinalis]XP_057675255.1 E3 ubiquitin-protein ligase LRSAM1 [Corythoichthys intestinalis]XP_061800771.1 E3 ubiquitin-protein ligase LRSAM1-like [Nerophis lumbriciformis]
MPLFFRKKKPSDDSKKRLEYQLCRSKEAGADDILDISSCELSEVPAGAFSICKVLQKKVLIVHNNELKSLLPKGIDITSLGTLKVLDLHDNKLNSLPEDIGKLTSLQILNVEKNRLKVIPESIGDLRLLQTLNLKGNCLSELPSTISSLSSLRTLDVSDNLIIQIPQNFAYIRTLENLILDAATMTYPPASVCMEGTENIQHFLCSELGEEYCPPSQYLLPVLEMDSGQLVSDCVDAVDDAWQNKFSEYEKRKIQKQEEKLAFERHREEKQNEHTQLLLMNTSHKVDILNSVRLEQERLEQGVTMQQRAQESERLLLLDKVRQAEDSISSRITNMLLDNHRQKKSAEFLQSMEEDRIRMEHLTAITQEEANSLRKREIAAAMQKMLSDNCAVSLLQEASDYRRKSLVSEASRSMESLEKKFDKMLSIQVLDKSKAIAQILQEEEMQKAAFQALQLQKDSVHGYIRNQIKLIEAELMQLTKLEVKRRNLDAENLQEVLVDQRTALGDLLQQLLKQKHQREQELLQVLVEMELKSESTQQNYWMIQYQRLLDAKPLSLRMQEAGVEKELVNLLCKLSAQHYLPIMAHHRVNTEALRHMNSSDLKKLGIAEIGIQKALLNWARDRKPEGACKVVEQSKDVPAPEPSGFFFSSLPNHSGVSTPSPPVTPGTPVTPSAPSPIEGIGSSECVVCMETGAQVIFLPCGHVCCCQVCSDALLKCPLCQGALSQRIRLYIS